MESDLDCVSDGDSPKLATRQLLFEVVEWSEQLRSVTSVWQGAARRSVQVQLCTCGCKGEKTFGHISTPRDLLPSIVLIKSRPSLTVFLLSSLRLSSINHVVSC